MIERDGEVEESYGAQPVGEGSQKRHQKTEETPSHVNQRGQFIHLIYLKLLSTYYSPCILRSSDFIITWGLDLRDFWLTVIQPTKSIAFILTKLKEKKLKIIICLINIIFCLIFIATVSED